MAHDAKGFPGRSRSLMDVIYDYLREQILSGDLPPGAALRQAHLAMKMGVSRAPVREALKALDSVGLVVFRPRRGYHVARLDVGEIVEIFEIRAILEEYGGRLAAQMRTAADIQALEELYAQMDDYTDQTPANIATWAALNEKFHTRLFQASGRRHLCRTTDTLRDIVERYVRADGAMAGRIDQAQIEHRQILDAFRAGHADEVGRLSRLHCEHTCRRLIASLKSPRASGAQEGETARRRGAAAGSDRAPRSSAGR